MTISSIDSNTRAHNITPTHVDRNLHQKRDEPSISEQGSGEYTVPAQKTEASRLEYSATNSDKTATESSSTFDFSSKETTTADHDDRNLNDDLRATKPSERQKGVDSPLLEALHNLTLILANHLQGQTNTPEMLNNKAQEILSKILGEEPIKEQAKPVPTSQDPEKATGRPVAPNNVGHEIPPASNAHAPENRSHGNHGHMQATPAVNSGDTGGYQPADTVSGSHLGHHGSVGPKKLHDEIENKAGYSTKDSYKRLLSEVNDGKSRSNLKNTADWTLETQRIDKDIMEQPLTQLLNGPVSRPSSFRR